MKNFTIFSALLLLAAGCATKEAKICTTELNDGYTRYTLSNGYIGVDVMPQLRGMISGVRYIPENRELFREMKIKVAKDDLLPPFPEVTSTGITDFLWGVTTKGDVPAKVISSTNSPEYADIVMNDRFFRMLNCEFTKQVSLKKDSSAVQIKITLRNHSKKIINAALWQNIIQSVSRDIQWDTIIIPCKGNTAKVGRKGVKFFEEDTVYQECDHNDREVFTAPARPWIAARSDLEKGVFILRTADELAAEGALFYTYKAFQNHTMEFISKPLAISPGKSAVYNLEYIFLPDMQNLSEVFGKDVTTGIHAAVSGKKMIINMQSSGVVPPTEWSFFLTGKDGKKYNFPKELIPELKPGKLITLKLPLPSGIPAGKYRFCGNSAVENFVASDTVTIK
ncbi:MAG: hypothetical protein IKC82_00395 [Lentisphaeria bacterium]|nr:hypothetical protein [Lentisphaeria bacterium]